MNQLILVLGLSLALVIIPKSSQAFGEQELGADGLRCDSCGTECSTVCGSRAFRTCCFNYIKKRSGSGSATAAGPHPDGRRLLRHNAEGPTGDYVETVGSPGGGGKGAWFVQVEEGTGRPIWLPPL